MALNSLSNDILVHELQLGEQLNESVHNERRSDFALMLAMLTDDARAYSQFTLPLTQALEKTTSTEQLRKKFQLPDKRPLALTDMAELTAFNQAGLVENKQLEHLRLANILAPKALAFRDNAKFITQQVMTNTSLYCQQQHEKQVPDKITQRSDFNVVAWLNAVQTTIVKAPLIEAYG